VLTIVFVRAIKIVIDDLYIYIYYITTASTRRRCLARPCSPSSPSLWSSCRPRSRTRLRHRFSSLPCARPGRCFARWTCSRWSRRASSRSGSNSCSDRWWSGRTGSRCSTLCGCAPATNINYCTLRWKFFRYDVNDFFNAFRRFLDPILFSRRVFRKPLYCILQRFQW